MIVEALSDAELEAWVRVQNAVEPDLPVGVVDLRRSLRHDPYRRYLLALRDGDVVGCAVSTRSSIPGRAFALPRVLSEARRQGVGTLLLGACAEHARGLGHEVLRSRVGAEDVAAMAFAARHGFREVDREVELVRPLGDDERPGEPPPGIRIVRLEPAQADALRELVGEGVEDMPVVGGLSPAPVEEMVEELTDAVASFAAWEGERLVGAAGLLTLAPRTGALEHALTTVARDRRGRGIAVALKQACVAWAAEHGYRELVTWTQDGNKAMQAVNLRAGFRPGTVSLTVEAHVP